ncbi:MAG: peroxiredoxin [Gammaproteobacteria bacterium]|nr:peroxiredoxin [Gammaproteobacteria bacterium]
MTILVGQSAPDFTAPAVLSSGEITDKFIFSKATRGKYALIFFYPLDFTFVCPSELIAINHRKEEFKKRHIEIISVSIDSQFTHFAWRNTPIKEGGIGPVNYTMVSDVNHAICKAYGVEHPIESVAFRGTFIIDKNGIVRSEIVNDLPIGRNVDEILRLFDAVDFYEQHGEVCPAGWHKGDKGMKASHEGVASYLAHESETL